MSPETETAPPAGAAQPVGDLAVRRIEPSEIYDREEAKSAIATYYASGDISKFTPTQRVGLVHWLCDRHGVTPEAFTWMTDDRGKVILYPNKHCAEQLRRRHQISIEPVRKETVKDLFVVEVKGQRPNGQVDFASKYVTLRDSRGNWLSGQRLCDAYARCETGAKRRLTFSMVGLSMPIDVSDERPAGLRPVVPDAYGNVIAAPTDEQRYLHMDPDAARVLGYPTFAETATASDSPIQGSSSSAPTEAELTPPKRSHSASGPRATFKPSEQQVNLWLRTWFATVDGTSLDHDHERSLFVDQWTEGRVQSLRTFFETATRRQAEDLLGHVRALVEDEKRVIAEAGREDESTEEAFLRHAQEGL